MASRLTCLEQASRLLARRAHFRQELASKLARRRFPQQEVETALLRLEELDLLDDRRTAEEFVRSRLARRPMGRRRLAQELARRGVNGDTAYEVLDHLLPDDGTLAEEAAERWRLRHPDGETASLARHLERQGFSASSIRRLIHDI